MNRFTSRLTVLLTGILLTVVAGCQPAPAAPSTSASVPSTEQGTATPATASEITSAPTQEPTQSSDEQIELLFWDTYGVTQNEKQKVLEEAVAEFEQKYPNIKIKREIQNFDEMRTLAKTALASGTGPDLIGYQGGEGFLGPLVQADLVLPLDQYVQQYGWKDRIYPWVWEDNTFNGKAYAVGNDIQVIGFYYNKDIFDKLGLSAPTTYDEFLDVCQKTKAAGYIPVSFANKAGWPAYHMFSIFANNVVSRDELSKALKGEGDWSSPSFVKAIQMAFVDLPKAGCLTPQPNALEYSEGNDLFFTGKAAMNMTGQWLYDSTIKGAKFNLGFFALPSIEGKPAMPTGGLARAFYVSATTKHPNEAAAFIDLLVSKDTARKWLDVGKVVPTTDADTTGLKFEPLFGQFVDTIVNSSRGAGLGYNIDVLTPPAFNDVMNSGFQAVLNGSRTPEEQAKEMQKAFQENYKRQ